MSLIPHDGPRPRSVTVEIAERYGMEPQNFERVLRATVVPSQCTPEQFAAFLLVAKKYDLNPVLKEIYAFPSKGGGIQPLVGVDGWMSLINRHPQCDGVEFDDITDDKGEMIAIKCRIWRKDRSRPTEVTEYMAECRQQTPTWAKWPRRMLRHKALIQAARIAFGFAGLSDEDEFERAESVRSSRPAVTLHPHATLADFAASVPQLEAQPLQGAAPGQEQAGPEAGAEATRGDSRLSHPASAPASTPSQERPPAQNPPADASAPSASASSGGGADADPEHRAYLAGRQARSRGQSRQQAVDAQRYMKHKQAAAQGWDDENAALADEERVVE